MHAVLNAVTHPTLPLLAIATETGKCNILSVLNITEPVIVKTFYLTRQSLDKIKFSVNGNILIVANAHSGRLFVIQGFDNMQIIVLTSINIPGQVFKFIYWICIKNF